MSNEKHNIAQSALNAALNRASKHAATAAVAAVLVPLAMTVAPGTGHATVIAASVTTTVTADTGPGGTASYAYDLSSAIDLIVTEIEIPEVAAGSFVLQAASSGSTTGLPYGWTETEVTSPDVGSPTLKPSGTPAAYIDLTDGGNPMYISPGSGAGFTLYADTTETVDANITMALSSGGYVTIDPPIPAPEPASLAILGTAMAGLVGMRRRKRS